MMWSLRLCYFLYNIRKNAKYGNIKFVPADDSGRAV
jgi:hypothetical protein